MANKFVNVPPMLIDDMGLVIGKNGKQFINITNLSGLACIWHDKSNNNIRMTTSGDSKENWNEQWRMGEILLDRQFDHAMSIINRRCDIDNEVDNFCYPPHCWD